MRFTEQDRQRLAKKRAEREELCASFNQRLAQANCHVVISTVGASVSFVHLDYKEPGGDHGQSLVLEVWSDEEFEEAILADSTCAMSYALAMDRAIRKAAPVIEEQAVRGFKRKFQELMA